MHLQSSVVPHSWLRRCCLLNPRHNLFLAFLRVNSMLQLITGSCQAQSPEYWDRGGAVACPSAEAFALSSLPGAIGLPELRQQRRKIELFLFLCLLGFFFPDESAYGRVETRKTVVGILAENPTHPRKGLIRLGSLFDLMCSLFRDLRWRNRLEVSLFRT